MSKKSSPKKGVDEQQNPAEQAAAATGADNATGAPVTAPAPAGDTPADPADNAGEQNSPEVPAADAGSKKGRVASKASVPARENGNVSEKAKGIFKNYPNVDELHFTSDGTSFFKKSDATNHAKGLKDPAITLVKR